MKTVAFTGYRPEKMPFKEDKDDALYVKFRSSLRATIKRLAELGATNFISGVAMGFDIWAAEEIIELKKQGAPVFLECAIPYPAQTAKWSAEWVARREKILKKADSITTISPVYSRECFFERNRYMVDKSEIVVCAFDGQSGGTAYTFNYATQKEKGIIIINPKNANVSVINKEKLEK